VQWQRDCTKNVHGEISGDVIIIYNLDEVEAWGTLMHEITEYKLQSVTMPYRILVKSLITTFENSIYAEKQKFIDFFA